MKWLRRAWDWLCGVGKGLLSAVCEAVVARAREIARDRDLVSLALAGVAEARKDGLKGEAAWARAREVFVEGLKAAGRELGDCAVDTALQLAYDAWKNRKA